MSQDEVNAALLRNMQRFMEKGPGLRYSTETPILARDRINGWVLLGGLGGMGVGEMWFRDHERYQTYISYHDAPERDSTGRFGTEPFSWRQ